MAGAGGIKVYRESKLFQEALAQEQELGLESTREGYPLSYPSPTE